MKRDLELIRMILEAVEQREEQYPQEVDIEGYDRNVVAFHVALLNEAGYIKAYLDQANTGEYVVCSVESITWKGYEFLELARNTGAWQKAKTILKEKSLSVPVTVLTDLLKSLVRGSLGM